MGTDSVRLDKWLWAARFYKTRSLATQAVAGGKVYVNGERAKPAKSVAPGDTVRIPIPPYEWIVVVRTLAERRCSQVAAGLYEETSGSRGARERLALGLRLVQGEVYEGKGRPRDGIGDASTACAGSRQVAAASPRHCHQPSAICLTSSVS